MAEVERHPALRQGHVFDGGVVVLDLWRLSVIFLADKSYTRWESDSGDRAVSNLRQFADDEVTRILLTSAIAIRIVDDREGQVVDAHTGPCGTIQSDRENPASMPLSLRDACNKIIHAERINFDLEQEADVEFPYLTPTIYLYGRLGAREWRAELSVMAYVTEATRILAP